MKLLLLDIDQDLEQVIRAHSGARSFELHAVFGLTHALNAICTTDIDAALIAPDTNNRRHLSDVITTLKHSGAAVIVVIHDIEELGQLSDTDRAEIDDFWLLPLDPRVVEARLDLCAKQSRRDAMYRALSQTLPDMLFRMSRDGTHIGLQNSTATWSYALPNSIIDAHISQALPVDAARQFRELITKVSETGDSHHFEYTLPIEDQEYFFEAHVTRGATGEVLTFVRDITKQKRYQEQIRAAAAAQKDFTSRILHAQELERRNLSRELHDSIGQLLLVHRLDAELIAQQVNTKPLQEAAERLCASLDRTLHMVRTLAMDLRPPAIDDLGIDFALETLVNNLARRSEIQCEFCVDSHLRAVPNNVGVILYRIAQEALNNAERHAQCQHLKVELKQRDSGVALFIIDDGIGIDPKRIHDPTSFGLLSMRERASLLGGYVTIDLAPEGGTRVCVMIPYAPFQASVASDTEAIKTNGRNGEP